MTQNDLMMESDLPSKLAKPAHRALEGAGYLQLEQLTLLSEAEVMQLHGMVLKQWNNFVKRLWLKVSLFQKILECTSVLSKL
ncbi:DNA-binding protein [Bacillus sp. V3B]|uniref:DNA-binding protein n=1 Tax=Bacillus sp. V3B TaxID=2804915 RepID=UPI0028112268|nr:DNA-binding protein [Bacillus sp. V3B]